MANRTRRPRGRRSLTEISEKERHYLLDGWVAGGWNRNIPHPRGRELWFEHRKELLEYWTQDPEKWQIPEGIPEGRSKWYWPKPVGPDGPPPWAFCAFEGCGGCSFHGKCEQSFLYEKCEEPDAED